MFVQEILDHGFRSVSVIGMGKNTGKTFAFNQLVMDAERLGIGLAMTTIGLDGEERDSLFRHDKPKIMLRPGQIVANAKTLLVDSGIDYEILGTTGIMTPLGEVILARALSAGKTVLAGPSTRHELALVKEQLEQVGIDVFFVDGAIDRRSLSAPMVTDTTVLAVGAEASWDRALLLEKLRLQLRILRLPAWEHPLRFEVGMHLRNMEAEVKLALLSAQGLQDSITQEDFFDNPNSIAEKADGSTQAIFVRGMLTDDVLVKILTNSTEEVPPIIVVLDPTSVFLSKQGFHKLDSYQAVLNVLDAIHISAVTVSPFNSRYGHADPLRLLADVGQAVYPIPAFDMNLGIRYTPGKEGIDAIS